MGQGNRDARARRIEAGHADRGRAAERAQEGVGVRRYVRWTRPLEPAESRRHRVISTGHSATTITSLEIMDDRGDQFPITDVDLVFSDKAAGHLPPPPDVAIESGTYFAEVEEGFGQFDNSGTDAWVLVVIDDDTGGMGEFDSWTLRGVPEPATLSLLALGALAIVRRRRR